MYITRVLKDAATALRSAFGVTFDRRRLRALWDGRKVWEASDGEIHWTVEADAEHPENVTLYGADLAIVQKKALELVAREQAALKIADAIINARGRSPRGEGRKSGKEKTN